MNKTKTIPVFQIAYSLLEESDNKQVNKQIIKQNNEIVINVIRETRNC